MHPPVLNFGVAAARLDAINDYAVVVAGQGHHMRRFGQRRLGRVLIANSPVIGHVIRRCVMKRLPPRHEIHLHRAIVDIQHDQLGRIPCFGQGFCNDKGHGLAHKTHTAIGQNRAG